MNNVHKYDMPKGLLFSVAGARGIVGRSIDENVVARFTDAFCSILERGSIVVGRDTRPSGKALVSAAINAVRASGRSCIDLGIAATPTVEMMVERHGAAGGIIVTASHNPAEWNALKFLDHRGVFITKRMSERLYQRLMSEHGDGGVHAEQGSMSTYAQAAEDHTRAILELDSIDANAIGEKSFKVAIDCINGAGSVMAPALLSRLGARVMTINSKIDGDFYRDPEPRPENLRDLVNKVQQEGADIGFALDPDADRLALVDPERGAISEEYTLALVVDYVLGRKSGPVVVNLSTSSIIDEIAKRHGVEVIRTPVGEAHVVEAMLEHGAVIGGEGNGGVILPDLHPGRDGLLAMALILQFLSTKKHRLSAQLKAYSPFMIIKEKAPLEGEFTKDRISDIISKQDPVKIYTGDGVKAVFENGWYHLRVSNTEGVVRIIAEAATEAGVSSLIAKAKDALATSW